MKKILVALLVLGMAGIAFAADAPTVSSSFSAYMDTGFTYTTLNNADALVFNGQDSGVANGRFNLNGSWSYGDFGLKFRLRNQNLVGMSSSSNTLSVRRAYVYYNLFDKMVEIDMGGLGVASYGTPYNGWATFDGPNQGLLIQVKPMTGLAIAYFLPVTGTAAKVADAVKGSTIAATYSIDKVGDLLLYAQTFGVSNGMTFIASFNLTAVDKLSASAEVKVANVGASSQALSATEDATYDLSPISVELTSNQGYTGSTLTYDLNVEPTYALNDTTTVGADFGYASTGTKISADVFGKVVYGKNFIKGTIGYDTVSQNAVITASFVSSF